MSNFLLTEANLVHALNLAIATIVCCCISMIVCYFRKSSLPFRHAVLVTGLVVCAVSPVAVTTSARFSFGTLPQFGASTAVSKLSLSEAAGVSPNALDLTVDVQNTAMDVQNGGFVEPIPTQSSPWAMHPSREATFVTRRSTLPLTRVFGTTLVITWFIGTVVVLARTCFGYRAIQRLLATCSARNEESISGAIRDAAAHVELKNVPQVLHSDVLPVPVVVGVWRPKVILPTDVDRTLSKSQLRAVLMHELAHIARRDHWIASLQNYTLMLYWWNPLVHIVYRQVCEIREHICDDIATEKLANTDDYAATLIRIAEQVAGFSVTPATLGISLSPVGELERRVRRILSRDIPSIRIRLGLFAFVGLLATLLLMVVGVALAQVPSETKVDAERDRDRPSLSQLTQAMARHERSYLPYHIKAMESLRMNEGLSPKERRQYPWADGRKHQKLMEYGQRDVGIWLRKETALKDDVVEAHFDQYNDNTQQIKVSLRPGSDDGLRVHLERDENQEKLVFCTPYAGVFPLSVYSEGMLLSDAIESEKTKASLKWDGADAVLEFQFGWVERPMRFLLWLSHKHDWHPIKLQRFNTATSNNFVSEWVATRLQQEDGTWRVKEGTLSYRHYLDADTEGAKVMYFVDFEVLESEFGDVVTNDRFTYEIPPHAHVHDAEKPKALEPIGETRTMTVTVIGIDDKPIEGATIRFQTLDGQLVDTVKSNQEGVGRSDNAPVKMSIDVTSAKHRRADWVLGHRSNEFRVILVPTTSGTTKSESGDTIPDVWITSRGLRFRADGQTRIPRHESAERDNDWSDDTGKFILDSDVTIRQLDQMIAIAAVDDSEINMAFAFVSASDLNRPLELILKPTCEVRGEFILKNVSEQSSFFASVKDSKGRRIASAEPSVQLKDEEIRVRFKLRLPEGEYRLESPGSAFHPPFSAPLSIKAGQHELDFGAVAVALTGLSSLIGKPAPELMVKWRSGEKSSIAGMRGNVVVLDFWGYWCVPCVEDMPGLMDIADQFKDQPIKWLSMSQSQF